MKKLIMRGCGVCMLVLTLSGASCVSKSELPAPTLSCPKPQAAAAWAMSPPSNSVQKLDQLFGISEPE